MIATRWRFARNFLRQHNSGWYCRTKPIPGGCKDPARTRPGMGLGGLNIGVVLVGILPLLIYPAVQAAELAARLDRNTLVQGETVTLVIQSNDTQQNLDGDLGVLADDFNVLDRRTETQMSIVNGQQSAVMRLILTLEPRRSGQLVIPPLQFDGSSTPALQLTVNPAPPPEPGEAPAVFIEVEVEPSDGPYYVHAQVRLTVRVFYQQNLTEAAITPPEPSPASVRLLDEVPFQADRGGNLYRVLERHYAVFPERSGVLVIPGMKLSGRLVARRSDNLWQPAVKGRRIEVQSDPVELQIQPRPAGFAGSSWLPARALQLSQNVSAGTGLSVGEPVTRTVIIDAVGLEENMLAEPVWPDLPGARIYPDRPQGITRDDGQWMLGHKEFRYAIVPEREGELVLPELRLHWWDTVNDRQVVAVLPEQRLQVSPSSAVPAATPPPAAAPEAPRPAGSTASAAQTTTAWDYWVWLTALFAGLWLVTLALYLRQQPLAKASPLNDSMTENETALLEDFDRTCTSGSPGEARRALSRWLRTHGPAEAGGSLLRFAYSVTQPELRQALLSLDASGFEPSATGVYDGRALAVAFSAWRKGWQRERRRQAPALTDLYAPARSPR